MLQHAHRLTADRMAKKVDRVRRVPLGVCSIEAAAESSMATLSSVLSPIVRYTPFEGVEDLHGSVMMA
eukprot:CAMPEP_0113272758 /NCGR_PEP_ID=MMETSP0008_2-20120614/23491_1 /TAXON_ID=97485 /ORGANISM="Prymnesium parvum" /LENGTH=67 /DNA_ID=CAMNT_0000122235 /DNA_START=1251 /DNA_END=1454 /DNA_ORIENTATION=- /assembly_acc=CAM_ASM_000153